MEKKNVFISHIHKDDHGLQKLKDLLALKGVEARDSSIHIGKFNNATHEGYIELVPKKWTLKNEFLTYFLEQCNGQRQQTEIHGAD
jgi:hypothetical protein